ncbi:hypothetical protein MRX96_006503 [Rhipicephalus microplus]
MWERRKLHNKRGHSYKTRARKLGGRAEKGCVADWRRGFIGRQKLRGRVQLCKQRRATVSAPAAAVVLRMATWRAHPSVPTVYRDCRIRYRSSRPTPPATPLHEQTPFDCTSSLAAGTKGLAGPPDGSRLRRRIDHRSMPPLFWLSSGGGPECAPFVAFRGALLFIARALPSSPSPREKVPVNARFLLHCSRDSLIERTKPRARGKKCARRGFP